MKCNKNNTEISKEIISVADKLGNTMDAHEFANYIGDIIDPNDEMAWDDIASSLAYLIDNKNLDVDVESLVQLMEFLEDEAKYLCDKMLKLSIEQLSGYESALAQQDLAVASKIRNALNL